MITPFRVSFIGGSVEDESCEFSSVDVGSSLEVRSAETEFSIVGCMGSASIFTCSKQELEHSH